MKIILISIATMIIAWAGTCDAQETHRHQKGHKYRVRSITTIKEPAVKSMDWHHGLNLIVFGKMDLQDKYYDVYIMKPDGSDEKCLTSNNQQIPQKHNGNPAWHPSGDFIVYTAEYPEAPKRIDRYAIPGSGLGCNLWIIDNRSKKFYQLTNYSLMPPIKGVIHPQFSHDGTKLFWAERVQKGENLGGG